MAGDKPYELTLVNRKFYVYAHVKADAITREIGYAYLTEMIDACRKYKKDKLMIYRDIPEMLSPEGIRGLSDDFAKATGNIKTAGVNPYLSREEAADSASFSADESNYRLFTSFKQAEVWLLS